MDKNLPYVLQQETLIYGKIAPYTNMKAQKDNQLKCQIKLILDLQ